MEQSNKVKFILTGFGKFNGVSDNPTTHLMKNITEYVNKERQQVDRLIDFEILSNDIVEVSAVSSKRTVDTIESLYSDHQHPIYIIHFGVNASAKCINLERCGWNDASFRVPDECGYCPNNEKIDLLNPECVNIPTSLPIDHLIEKLCTSHSVEPSTDPGRFVCNYIYYNSLMLSKKSSDKFKSLFVHVPPFTVVSMENQLKFVVDLLSLISKL
ncbi:hypothetical protein PPL_02529 [Heterostelium album PN500]|uniref:Pyroglutamyl-peptidase I n=1 Tax=Heterostelium pallidum (strain ATCC 26659 / Pp 5 / PN500) TaxID=670386 RepID=D3B2C0_HETP5|nr:hypothetical protein PPL_02529 [Heterostelium album PN500]EFA84495.1 hypothetical protein PPL_02529 [Heterostelium album PN500]|eukprot:XP_020436609.1 hypothetical protein PPL_02529 [Heterostelium album PN500]